MGVRTNIESMKKRVIILGSTGSIGKSTLSVIREANLDYEIVGLSAGSRWEELAQQAEELSVPVVAMCLLIISC